MASRTYPKDDPKAAPYEELRKRNLEKPKPRPPKKARPGADPTQPAKEG